MPIFLRFFIRLLLAGKILEIKGADFYRGYTVYMTIHISDFYIPPPLIWYLGLGYPFFPCNQWCIFKFQTKRLCVISW